MNVYEEYKKKLVSAEEAVKIVKSGDWVDYSQTCSQKIWTLPLQHAEMNWKMST